MYTDLLPSSKNCLVVSATSCIYISLNYSKILAHNIINSKDVLTGTTKREVK